MIEPILIIDSTNIGVDASGNLVQIRWVPFIIMGEEFLLPTRVVDPLTDYSESDDFIPDANEA